MNVSLIIVGAGKGERFGKPKAEIRLAGKFLIDHILETVKDLEWMTQIVFVGSGEHKGVFTVKGGDSRIASVQKGLKACKEELVMIHNLANPLASEEDFQALYEALIEEKCAAFTGQQMTDTVRRMSSTPETIDRTDLWRVQTPQGFYRKDIVKAHQEMNSDGTDDIQLVEDMGISIKALPTHPMNVKITYAHDLEMMEKYLGNEVRNGIGEDSHAFDTSGEMRLGGVTVPGFPKLLANSDGDVILHALFNAISSAMGKGSLGPVADPMCAAGVTDSQQYLQVILDEMKQSGYGLQNISVSLECAWPKIDPLVPTLKQSLSQALHICESMIGITAHTGDKLSSFGKGEGIRCISYVSLWKV
ncbi:MAG: 2-C-methyl-D-erythritol 2,4-cyclodiphosphate synthase [Candidatus Gracilibacteria bacterium]|nr:2-C-methyl-D-erythritol 2,4-cyclodiphosphate synthase [Candidatus Gracilibacteria bacterium]